MTTIHLSHDYALGAQARHRLRRQQTYKALCHERPTLKGVTTRVSQVTCLACLECFAVDSGMGVSTGQAWARVALAKNTGSTEEGNQ